MPVQGRRCSRCKHLKLAVVRLVEHRLDRQDNRWVCTDCLEKAGQMLLRTERLEVDGDRRHYE